MKRTQKLENTKKICTQNTTHAKGFDVLHYAYCILCSVTQAKHLQNTNQKKLHWKKRHSQKCGCWCKLWPLWRCSMHLACCVVASKHKKKRKQNKNKTQRQTEHKQNTLSLSLTHTHTHTHNRNAVASASSGEFSGGVQCVLPAGNFRESFFYVYTCTYL